MRLSKIHDDPEVAAVFATYPADVNARIQFIRQLILETASTMSMVDTVNETLKWGEPSYVVTPAKIGSTVRVAWKPAEKDEYAVYFKCTANLVPAFRERFATQFRFGGNRSIVFNVKDDIPVRELKQCVALAMTYHKNKHLTPEERWQFVDAQGV